MYKVFAIVTLYVAITYGDILFPKDTSIDFVFPPKMRASNIPGMGIGHLRPLGKLNIIFIFIFQTQMFTFETF